MSKVERYRLITEYPKDEFFDNKQVVKFDAYEVIRTLNQQDQRIAELEEQLKNAIVPKFKIGQEVWVVFHHQVFNFTIHNIKYDSKVGKWRYGLNCYCHTHIMLKWEDVLLATKEEALAKLKGE